ncbi:MAG: molybdenum cofactor guanylyltransferase [Clostridia bacterium]|nr:molybdenum cofactor guanylyltransferase [Clostridia bacterium]
MKQLAAVVLTGGKSSRMGTDKAFLPMPNNPNETFLSHTLSLVRHFPVVALSVAAEDAKYDSFNCIQIPDRWPEIGPMGGIASVLSALEADAVLVLACDTPYLSPELITRLTDAFKANPDAGCICCTDADGRYQPLCAIYARSALPCFLEAIAQGKYALRYVIDQLKTIRLTLDKTLTDQAAANINTPEEYKNISNSQNGGMQNE